MPTYEYRCSDCGHVFEVHQRIDEDSLTVCERCGGRLRKVFHPAGIVFKGSGFYATDSRAASKKAGSKEGSDAKKSSETKTSDTKQDSSGAKSGGDSASDKGSSKSDTGATKKPAGSGSSS